MNRKTLLLLPLALLAASCSDFPTGSTAGPAAPGRLSFYVAPPGDVVVYGTEWATAAKPNAGDLWAVNLSQGTTHLMYDWPDPSGDRNSPNAVAFDAANGRMYFSVNTSENFNGTSGTEDKLYLFDVANPTVEPLLVGTLPQTAYSADFSGGSYYYVPNVMAKLIRVDFDAAGYPTGATTLCTSFRRPDLGETNRENRLYFGDIAIKDGIVYGSAMINNDRTQVKFFKLTISTCAYQEWQAAEETMLQLAWGVDGVLYGHVTETGLYYEVDPSNGARSAGPGYSPAGLHLTDIAPAFNPAAPAIRIVTKTNGTDNNSPTGPQVPVGQTVSWTYEVTNTGNVPLSNVGVTDDRGVVVSCPKTTLAVGETMVCTATGPAVEGQYANLGTATGSYNGATVQDTDPDHYFGLEPAFGAITGCAYVDWNGSGARDIGLGAASQYGIFVINGGELIMNSSTVWGDVALGPDGNAKTLAKTTLDGRFYFHPGTSRSVSAKDFLDTSGNTVTFVSRDLAAAQADANAASAAFAAMTPNQTYGNVTGNLTITGTSGINVISMSSVNVKSQVITFSGSNSAVFVVNVAGQFEFAQSEIRLTGGVTANNIVWNFPTAGSTILLYKAENIIRGTFLAPQRDVNYHNPASFEGAIIAKGLNLHSMGNLRHRPTTFREPCLDGATMRLTNGGTREVTTTAAGYTFSSLPAATYTLTLQALPSGYTALQAIPGTLGGTATSATTTSGIVLPSGAIGSGYDFRVRKD
jgi:hypothetical protein